MGESKKINGLTRNVLKQYGVPESVIENLENQYEGSSKDSIEEEEQQQTTSKSTSFAELAKEARRIK